MPSTCVRAGCSWCWTTASIRSLPARHLAWYLALAERAEPALLGPDQAQWLARLSAEHDNLRAALAWCVRQRASSADTPAKGAAGWTRRRHATTARQSARAKALNGAGAPAYYQGDYERANVLYEAGLALRRQACDARGVAGSLGNLGVVADDQGDYARAGMLYEESLRLRRQLGDTYGITIMLNNLGNVARQQGEYKDWLPLPRKKGFPVERAPCYPTLPPLPPHYRRADSPLRVQCLCMLEELNIADFAIIDNVTVRLEPGFNVLTGETGAGKSIIIDAVSAVLGGRTSSEVVRTGAKGARVEAVFSLEEEVYAGVTSVLAEFELFDEDEANESLILSREISATGRSTARINGRPVPASVLAQVGELLVDIHGQSEHLSLFKVAGHVDLLDRYAGTGEQRRAIADLVGRLRRVQAEEDRLREARRDAARRLDLLNYQVDEITAATLRPDEEEELEAERTVLANADRLATLATTVLALLSGGENEDLEISAQDLLNRAALSLGELARIDQSQAPLLESLRTALYGVEEAARDMARYADAIDADPARLAQLEERTAQLQGLKRKYGDTIEEVIAYGERAAAEQAELLGAEDRLEELAAEDEALRAAIGRAGAALSALRRAAADDLARRVEGQLADLAMSRARFAVSIDWRPDGRGVPVPEQEGRFGYDETGLDRVEFLISPNPGEALKPLARIASGGEASRLMLALKTILSDVDRTPTLIFDEVDTGVGGRSGGVVGEKLRDLGRRHQVICITHLPQVAALGDLQLRIEKQIVGDRTRTAVYPLEGQDRVDEIASMIGGTPVSASARQSALDLLARGREQTAGAR